MGSKRRNDYLSWLAAIWIGVAWWLQGGIAQANGGLQETAPPTVIAQLASAASGSPQVYVLSPRNDEVVNSSNVSVSLQVQGVPIFKNAAWGLGPHLHLLLDRAPYQSVYDLSQPAILSNLTPGTHTLQVLMAKPWHESWKNPEAFAQVTFHVFAKSADVPVAATPTLVYNEPGVSYGAEPFLLDFYLANAPHHLDARQRLVNDWRVRATINNQSFEIDRWQPFYLKGLQPGANLIRLEYLNAQGQSMDSALRVVDYQPNGTDGLSRLLRNELSLATALALFDPNSKQPLAVSSPPVMAMPPPAVVVAPPAPQPVPTAAPIAAEPVIIPPPAAVQPVATPAPLPPPQNPIPVQQPIPVSPSPLPAIAEIPKPAEQLPLPSPEPSFPPSVSSPLPVPPSPPVSAVPLPLPPKTPVAIAPPTPTAPVLVEPVIQSPSVITPVPLQPPTWSPAPGTDVIEFKVLAREFLRTASVRIKEFTNSIPPTVAKWSQNLGHWIADRTQAMRSGPKSN